MATLRQRRESQSIPTDLLTNILVRLPIKCLLQLKLVCKSWYSLITSREFANLHLFQNSVTSHRLLVFSCGDHSLYSVNLDLPVSRAIKIPFPAIEERFSRKNIAGSCNGLLLCLCDETPNFEALILNPSSLPCRRVLKLQLPQNCLYVNYGFGYDSTLDDYKVVRIVQFLHNLENLYRETSVYSLRGDCWKVIGQEFSLYGTPISQNGALVQNHLLHWLFWCPPFECHVIGALDVCNEQWSDEAVPMPPYNNKGNATPDSADLGVLDECLCLLTHKCREKSSDEFDLWVLKEYGVDELWTKIFNIEDVILARSLEVIPIAYSKGGNEIMLRRDKLSKVFWYDLTEKRVRSADIQGVPNYHQVNVCIQSLVPIRGAALNPW